MRNVCNLPPITIFADYGLRNISDNPLSLCVCVCVCVVGLYNAIVDYSFIISYLIRSVVSENIEMYVDCSLTVADRHNVDISMVTCGTADILQWDV